MKKTKDDEMMAQMLKELIPGAVDMYIHISCRKNSAGGFKAFVKICIKRRL